MVAGCLAEILFGIILCGIGLAVMKAGLETLEKWAAALILVVVGAALFLDGAACLRGVLTERLQV